MIAQTCVINVQSMFDRNDILMDDNILKKELNDGRKVKNCVLFLWIRDKTNAKTTYTLYKHVSTANESSKIKDETIDNPLNPIDEGCFFLDRDAKLEYPDTLELRYNPTKGIFTHCLLYKEGEIIFNIPLPNDVGKTIEQSIYFFFNNNKHPIKIFSYITKTVYHNGWYPEKIYPKKISPLINMSSNDWHSTWQHYACTSLKAVLLCLIVYFELFANESLKDNLRFCALFFVMLIAIAKKIKT